jgi:hypothetical protein
MLRDPLGPAQRRLICAGVAHRKAHGTRNLLRQRRLADLPRPGHHLHEAAWLRQPLGQHGGLRALVWLFAHDVEYFYSTY